MSSAGFRRAAQKLPRNLGARSLSYTLFLEFPTTFAFITTETTALVHLCNSGTFKSVPNFEHAKRGNIENECNNLTHGILLH